jgi:hypothetical protein
MANQCEPVIEQWYLRRDKGEMFRVVAVDANDGAVDVQNFGGDVEELDREAWLDLDIELADPPENWTGPFDDIETDDLGDTESAMPRGEWLKPLESLRSEDEPWQDSRPEDERDEEEEGHPAEKYAEEDQPARDRAR